MEAEMPGIVIEGKQYPIGDLNIRNFLDDKKYCLRMGNDGRLRHKAPSGDWHWIRGLFLHVTGGPVDKEYQRDQHKYILPGLPAVEDDADERILRSWTLSDSNGGAHYIVDFDTSIICTCDSLTDAAYHATSCNEYFDGLEMLRGSKDGVMYDGQLDAVVTFCDGWTRLMGVQRQFQWPYRPYKPVPRLVAGGADCVGLFGHRDQTDGRGPLDPGDPIFEKLRAAGYEPFDFAAGEDRQVWMQRQQDLKDYYHGAVDGIAGPGTVKALGAAGYKHGLWVSRPGD